MEDHFSTWLAQQTSAFRTDHLDRTFFQQQQSLLCLQGNCRNGSQVKKKKEKKDLEEKVREALECLEREREMKMKEE